MKQCSAAFLPTGSRHRCIHPEGHAGVHECPDGYFTYEWTDETFAENGPNGDFIAGTLK